MQLGFWGLLVLLSDTKSTSSGHYNAWENFKHIYKDVWLSLWWFVQPNPPNDKTSNLTAVALVKYLVFHAEGSVESISTNGQLKIYINILLVDLPVLLN